MRTRLIPAALALLLLLETSAAALAAPATPAPAPTPAPKAAAATATKAPPTATPVPPTATAVPATATAVPPTATPKPEPTAAPTSPPAAVLQQTVVAQVSAASRGASTPPPAGPAVQQTVEAQVASASRSASQSPAANATPTAPAVSSAFSITGVVFLDLVGSGYVEGAPGVANVPVRVVGPTGREWPATTDAAGVFKIEGLTPGTYHVSVQAPRDLTAGTRAEQVVEVTKSAQKPLLIGLSPTDPGAAPVGAEPAMQPGSASPEPSPSAEPEETPATEVLDADQQDAAMLAIVNLPIRFAPGRDTLAQVARRALGDGSVWLGVPFRTQIDGSQYQFVNCGPASLTMVLAGFGLDVGPDEVRGYLNSLTHDYSTDIGTSLDVLSAIAREAGLEAIDLYSARGGYRTWTMDAIRWHVQQGHPVITLVKYHNLPGHTQSPAETDHYIVITGLTPDGFIYNDAAFASTMGYGLEIKEDELETAWDNSSIPHNAVAMALPQPGAVLSFPERPQPTPAPEAEEAQPAPLVSSGKDGYLPAEGPALPAPSAAAASVYSASEAAPSAAPESPDGAADEAPAEESSAESAVLDGTVETPQITIWPDAGPLRLAPQVAVLLGALWAAAMAWTSLVGMGRRLPAIAAACVRFGILLACFHVL